MGVQRQVPAPAGWSRTPGEPRSSASPQAVRGQELQHGVHRGHRLRGQEVARALVSHYFGGKRQLYLEVVRQMMVVPGVRLAAAAADHREKSASSICVDRWLEVVERNRDMWLSAIGLEALGNDPRSTRSCSKPTRSRPTGSSRPP